MRNLDIFRGYMELMYSDKCPPIREKDITIDNFIIGRFNSSGFTVHYLYNGSSLSISSKWLDMFKQLYFSNHSEIFYNASKDTTTKDLDKYLDTFIYLNTNLQTWLGQSVSKVSGPEFLDCLSSICEMKTGRFRKFMREEYEIDLEPFKYCSLSKSFDI